MRWFNVWMKYSRDIPSIVTVYFYLVLAWVQWCRWRFLLRIHSVSRELLRIVGCCQKKRVYSTIGMISKEYRFSLHMAQTIRLSRSNWAGRHIGDYWMQERMLTIMNIPFNTRSVMRAWTMQPCGYSGTSKLLHKKNIQEKSLWNRQKKQICLQNKYSILFQPIR